MLIVSPDGLKPFLLLRSLLKQLHKHFCMAGSPVLVCHQPSSRNLILDRMHCRTSTLDHLGHHAVTCKYGGDMVTRHNMIRDILVETCRQAHIGVKVEVGNNLSRDHSKTRPADILLPNWFLGRTAALDVSITSPLNPVILLEVEVSATAAAQATESRKHHPNDPKCSDLGWVCVPMVVETYGAWGKEATAIISSVASRLATSMCRPKSIVLNEIYGRLNLHLVRANATTILSRIARLL